MALSQDGLFSKTQEAADKYKKAQEDEELEVEKIEYAVEGKNITKVEEITEVNEFKSFRDEVNNGEKNFENTLIKLTDDLDLSGETWTPIETKEHPFNGVFNGNGHKISNLTIDNTTTNQGLFGYNIGIIKSIGVEGETIELKEGTKVIAGIIAGCNEGLIESCYNKAEITSENIYNLGGIVGYNKKGGKVNKCYNEGKITGKSEKSESSSACGGICGGSSSETTIMSCYNSGELDLSADCNNFMVGGIAGYCKGDLDSCYNRANISVENATEESLVWQAVGGINGQAETGSITRCYNIGNISVGDNFSYLGKASILGRTHTTGMIMIRNCFMKDNLNVTYSWPGKPEGKTAEFIENATEITEDVKTNLYERLGENFIKDDNNINNGYPILEWQ